MSNTQCDVVMLLKMIECLPPTTIRQEYIPASTSLQHNFTVVMAAILDLPVQMKGTKIQLNKVLIDDRVASIAAILAVQQCIELTGG
jgi:hypothetical protein